MNKPTPTQPTNTTDIVANTLIFFVAIGLTIWFTFGDIWPVTMFIDIQADMMDGSYYPKLTFMVTLLSIWLPLLGIHWAIKKIRGK